MEPITVFAASDYRARPVQLDRSQLLRDIRTAAYRFWLSERRPASAIVVSFAFGEALLLDTGEQLVGDLRIFGTLDIDDLTHIPVIGRPGALDPLFQFL